MAAESGIGPTESRSGIQLSSRQVTSMGELLLYTGEHDMSDATIKEFAWDLSRIVERPTLVTTFSWQMSAPSNILFIGAVPSTMLSMALSKIPFQSFLYWRGDAVLNLQIAGSPLVQGILGMTFVPLVSYDELQTMVWDYSSLSLNPTVYLYANTNTNAELRIPYNHPQAYLSSNFPDPPSSMQLIDNNLGFVVIYVLEPFMSAGSLNSVTVSLFSHLENSEFKVPQLSSTIEMKQMASIMSAECMIMRAEGDFISSALSALTSAGSQMLDPVMEDLGHLAKGTLKSVATTTARSLADKMGAKALPSNFIGDAIDMVSNTLGGVGGDILGLLGLDNPTIPTEEGRVIVKGSGNLNAAVGPEYIEKLSVLPSGLSIVTPETFGTVSDEMDVNYLYRKYSYVGRFEIKKTDSIGTVVFGIPLSPMPTFGPYNRPMVGAGAIVQSTVWFPLISYLGLPYRYWTGGLKYKFLVSATAMHTCKIFVSFNYGASAVPVNLLDAASQYGTALEITQGSNEFEFSVPYVAALPYLYVSRGTTNSQNSMGMLYVTILNELIAPDSVPPEISVAVFICGSDDFSYEILAGVNPAFPVWSSSFQYQVVDPPGNQAQRKLVSIRENLTHGRVMRAEIHEESKEQEFYDDDEYVVMQAEALEITINIPKGVENLYAAVDQVMLAESAAASTAPTNVAPTVTDIATGDHPGLGDDQIAPPQNDMVVDDHFGITNISLRNYMKKYQFLGEISFAANTTYPNTSALGAAIDLSSYLLTPQFEANLVTTRPYGLWSWCTSMFKQFKGGLRFKVIFNMVNHLSGGAVQFPMFSGATAYYFPGFIPDEDRVGTDSLGMLPNNTIYETAAVGGTAVIYNPTYRVGCLSASTSNVMEFEIPYQVPYLSLLTGSGSVGMEKFVRDIGLLYITCNVPVGVDLKAQLFIAFADETRLATLFRVPIVLAPGVYNTGVTPYRAVANVGFGQYLVVGNQLRAEGAQGEQVMEAEGDALGPLMSKYLALDDTSDDALAAVQNAGISFLDDSGPAYEELTQGLQNKVEVEAPANQPANPQTGSGAKRKVAKTGFNVTTFGKFLRATVAATKGLKAQEMLKLINSTIPPTWRRKNMSQGIRILSDAGIQVGSDGTVSLIRYRYGKTSRNRKPFRRVRRKKSQKVKTTTL